MLRTGPIRRWARAGLVVTLLLAACGGDGDGAEDGPPDGAATAIRVTAQSIAFDTSTITVDAGEAVTIEFSNEDPVAHNVAVYETDQAQAEIFVGEIFTGPETTTYEFTAPSEPGTYFFRCDVHPQIMQGDFVVE